MQKEEYINSVNLNSATDFPYLVLEGCDGKLFPVNKGFRVMHWHEDIQLIYVIHGELSVKTLDDEVIIRDGEGIFINKYVVHFISYEGSCQHALDYLRNLMALEQSGKKPQFYAYEVLVNLTGFWLELCKNIELPPMKQEQQFYKRMRLFLDYIETHYAENITLDDIAACASVSRAECLRCFKKSMQMTPYQYLIELRLAKAAALLRQTDEPVGDIALNVGFQQSSHFGKFFKAKTGMTPLAYRKQP